VIANGAKTQKYTKDRLVRKEFLALSITAYIVN
jgi:hypothetical protein